MQLFLMETDFELRFRLADELRITRPNYLSEIFNRFNYLNLSLQKLSCDGGFKIEYTILDLGELWLKAKNEYPFLSRKALLFLIPFAYTYLCKTLFSAMETCYATDP
uniref:Uncharacterized protein n=1 Tax=Timema poppense TaxID=170557 RepID=A0A7R9GVF7_TIMPO|nr:unnamed protein product [Timema poppensis]